MVPFASTISRNDPLMKSLRLLLHAATVLSVAPLIHAHLPDASHITVYGEAVTEVSPDVLQWTVGIFDVEDTPAAAAKAASGAIEGVLRFLRERGIAEEDIQTSLLSIGEEHEHRMSNWVKIGYRAGASVEFEQHELGATVALWSGLSELDGIQSIHVSRSIDNRSAIEDETRLNALANAHEKASALAEAAAVRLVEPLLIEEIVDANAPPMARMAYASSEAGSPGLVAPGRLSVTMRIKVTYRITGK